MALRIASALTPQSSGENAAHSSLTKKVLMSAIGPKRTQAAGRPTAPWRDGRSQLAFRLSLSVGRLHRKMPQLNRRDMLKPIRNDSS